MWAKNISPRELLRQYLEDLQEELPKLPEVGSIKVYDILEAERGLY